MILRTDFSDTPVLSTALILRYGAGNVLLDSWHNQTIETKKSNKATPYPSAHLYLTECTIFRHRRTSGSSPITNRRQAAHIP